MSARPKIDALERRALLSGSALPQGEEFRVNSATLGEQHGPAVAVDDAGGFVVVFTESPNAAQPNSRDGSQSGVFARRYDAAGAATGAEFQVNTTAEGAQLMPDVAMTSDGRFIVVWADLLARQIRARRFDAAGAPLGADFRVDNLPLGDPNAPTSPRVFVDDTGAFSVLWSHVGTPGIALRTFTSSGTPFGGDTVLPMPGNIKDWDIAADPQRRLYHAYAIPNPDPFGPDQIYVRRYTFSGQLTGTSLTSPQGLRDALEVTVAAEPDGDFTFTWLTQDTLGPLLQMQRRRANGALESLPVRLTPDRTQTKGDPQLALLDDGRFVVTWEEGSEVVARVYGESNQPLGAPLRVNTYTDLRQSGAAVAVNPDGDFVVAWTSGLLNSPASQDGDGQGVFAQRYAVGALEAPTVVSPHHDWKYLGFVELTFGVNAELSFDAGDVELRNLTTGTVVDPLDYRISYLSNDNNELRMLYPYFRSTVPVPGDYRLTIRAAGITNNLGTPMAADATFDFWVLPGDANRDRTVNLNDFNILVTNFGRTSGVNWPEGDFNYDGRINLTDFNFLASAFGVTLPPLGSPGDGSDDDDDDDDDTRAPLVDLA